MMSAMFLTPTSHALLCSHSLTLYTLIKWLHTILKLTEFFELVNCVHPIMCDCH
jgi:hypothetical protein